MFGWRSRAIALASRMKRPTCSELACSPASSPLSATEGLLPRPVDDPHRAAVDLGEDLVAAEDAWPRRLLVRRLRATARTEVRVVARIKGLEAAGAPHAHSRLSPLPTDGRHRGRRAQSLQAALHVDGLDKPVLQECAFPTDAHDTSLEAPRPAHAVAGEDAGGGKKERCDHVASCCGTETNDRCPRGPTAPYSSSTRSGRARAAS